MTMFHNLTIRGALAGLLVAAALIAFGPGRSLAQDADDDDLEAFLSESEPPAFDDQGAVVDAFKKALEADNLDDIANPKTASSAVGNSQFWSSHT